MIKIPARPDGQWTLTQSSDKLPDISATRNLTFDKEGYLRLSKPAVSFYSDADDADFGIPLLYAQVGNPGAYWVITDDSQFELDMYNSGNGGTVSCQQTSATNAPVNTGNGYASAATYFSTTVVFVNPTDHKCYTHVLGSFATSWVVQDTSAFLTANHYAATSFSSTSNIAIVDGSTVEQANTSYAAGTKLTLPAQFGVTGLAYNNNYLGITTYHTKGHKAAFYLWDGQTTAANFVAEVPAPACWAPIAYGNTFAFLSSTGIIYQWNGSGIQPLAALPLYYTGGVSADGVTDFIKNTSITADGELIYINLRSKRLSPDEYGGIFDANEPAGVWCYDPAVGLYHRHAPTGTKIVVDTVATTSVDTGNDEVTLASAPETGTPIRYSAVGGTAITGLTDETLYYAIKVDSTDIQLAASYADAIAGTEITLSGTGNSSQTFQTYLKTDFGNSYTTDTAGGLWLENNLSGSGHYNDRLFWGHVCAKDTTTEQKVGGFILEDTENRGHFITSKFLSAQLQEDWQKMFIKHRDLVSDLDKIVIKYRIDNNEPLTRIKSTSDGVITWSDSDTFTTTDTQWANVQAGDEVEIIQGTGSGYLVHVSSISEAGGTYTVNLDETIKNLTATKTGRAVASRWTKLTTLDNDIISNEDGYSEVAIGVKSKQIQFKIELRGEDVEIEEILVAHSLHKPVA